jgi:DNA-binding XRE family transcriptional regulator
MTSKIPFTKILDYPHIMEKVSKNDGLKPLITSSDIRIFRATFGLTQTELGLMMGVSRPTISLYERDESDIPIIFQLAISKIIDDYSKAV